MRIAPGHAGEFEPAELFGNAAVSFQTRDLMRGEGQIFPQCHVRKERIILKNVAAVPLLRWQMNARSAVVKDAVVEHDAARIGLDETCNGIQSQGFAGTAGSIKCSDTRGGFKLDLEMKAG